MPPAITTILVPTDFSCASDRAMDYAAALAGPLDATLHLLHVVEDPFPGGAAWGWYGPDGPAVYEQMAADSRTRLLAHATLLAARSLAVTTEIGRGVAADAIVRAAADCGADLVVMSTHGRSGLPHLLLGSVAERVLRTAPCPVLALPHPADAPTGPQSEAASSPA